MSLPPLNRSPNPNRLPKHPSHLRHRRSLLPRLSQKLVQRFLTICRPICLLRPRGLNQNHVLHRRDASEIATVVVVARIRVPVKTALPKVVRKADAIRAMANEANAVVVTTAEIEAVAVMSVVTKVNAVRHRVKI